MPQEMKMIEAIKMAIQTEKDVMDFYLKAAALTENERGKKVFEQLASEEREHAGHFFKIYTGSDLGSFEDFMANRLQPAIPCLSNWRKLLMKMSMSAKRWNWPCRKRRIFSRTCV